ncbi:MAG TPA: 30S ribosomal protein S20 [Candidatus Jorgensenbacteria bacterium]|nr:30S ribosomal protein S20 [Candidatus Jorgensenbacteria bacterium]
MGLTLFAACYILSTVPNTTSAKKALRKSLKRRTHNIQRKALLKDSVKRHRKLLEGGKIKDARALLPQAYKIIDKLAKVHTITKNKARRLKSQLAKRSNSKGE